MNELKYKGFIQLPRELLQHPLRPDSKFTKWEALIDLYFMAAYKISHYKHKGKLIQVKVGQVSISQNTLARKWLWSRGSVIRFLNDLEMVHTIVQDKTSTTTLITILNYNTYQKSSTSNGTRDGTDRGTIRGTHPNKDKKERSAAPISTENGLAPIKFIKP